MEAGQNPAFFRCNCRGENMKKKLLTILVSALAISIAIPSAVPVLSAEANSAQTHWSGSDALGAFVTDGDCPIVVEHEKLTLRVPDFPSDYYETKEEQDGYSANVTAEYTFYNPSGLDVTATLAFPFGMKPTYSYMENADDTSRYDVTIDGAAIEKKIRHTYSGYYFDLEGDLPKLSTERITEETPVRRYTYSFTGVSNYHSVRAEANLYGLRDPAKTCVIFDRGTSYSMGSKENNVTIWIGAAPFVMYVIGEPLNALPQWESYSLEKNKKVPDGRVTLRSTEEMTFSELAYMYYKEESGVSRSDWFNAVTDLLCAENGEFFNKGIPLSSLDVSDSLMRWYEYTLEIPAGGRVVNSVTAPLYPSIDLRYIPPIYSYTYLLSPASTWAEFGEIEVELLTDFFVTESSVEFKRRDDGYFYTQKGLPEGELTFTLSSEENPQRDRSYIWKNIQFFLIYFGWIFLIILILLGEGIVGIVIAIRKKRRGQK